MSVKGKKRTEKKLSVSELETRMNDLMEYCDTNIVAPSNYIVKKFLGVSPDTIQNWRNETVEDESGKVIKSEYSEIIKNFDLYRESFWLNIGLKNPKLQGFVAFNLKQPWNGGYADKQPDSGGAKVEVTIKTAGIGGDDAFK